MQNRRAFVIAAILSLATILLVRGLLIAANPTQSREAATPPAKKKPTPPTPPPVPRSGPAPVPFLDVPVAIFGNNLYMVWPNNNTGHWNVFFVKSIDGGKSLNTTIISAPNRGHIIDQNTQISASGSNVYVTWWTNKTGTLMPVFRASNDNGNTFAKTIMLNGTG
jgi:hypothetical protein